MSKLMFMYGLPASGKSEYAEKLSDEFNAMLLSSDIMREKLLGDINDQSKNAFIFEAIHYKAKLYLKADFDVVIDSTNLDKKQRIETLKMYKEFAEKEQLDIKTEIYILNTSLEECLKRNSNRDRHVPEKVILNMYKYMKAPTFSEGWNEIYIINEQKKKDE